MRDRVHVLVGITILATSAGNAFAAGGTESAPAPGPAGEAVPSLAVLYKPYFPIGAALGGATIATQGALLAAQVNSLVAENDMKWEVIHPVSGNEPADYNFGPADKIVAFAQDHGMLARGHNLVWHQQVPAWVFAGADGTPLSATKAEVLARLQEHITTLLRHFKDEVYCWDVVNEALSDRSWRTDSPWHKTAGSSTGGDGIPDYVEKAFEYAREVDPSVKLFYNDYGIESGSKFERAFAFAKALKAKGLLDGIGIQGHWSIYSVDPKAVGRAIERFASLGLQVQITELDLSVYRWGDSSSLASLPPDRAELQARRYGELFRVFREEGVARALAGVTFWGIADDHTWLDHFPVAGRKDRPLLFDERHQPKKAFWAVARW